MPETLASTSEAASSLHRLTPGSVIADRYEVVALLGHGGMGAVFRVRDRELDEDVALKILKPEIAAVEGALDRFRREVKLARRVTHPNVARTFDLGSHEGVRYLTMELIAGEPLSKRARFDAGRLPLSDVLRVATEIARGLAAAHAVGVVHRDLKPENVMVAETAVAPPRASLQPPSTGPRIAPSERIVLTDFGIARLAEDFQADAQTSALQTVGGAIGTPAYMAPEQLEGRELDGRADVYALGIVLFELLTGAMPFEGETVFAIAAARLRESPPDPRTKAPSIPEAVATLVVDALARKREHRPDAQTLLQRIEALRGCGADDGAAKPRPMIPDFDFDRYLSLGPRSVAVLPFEARDERAQRLGVDLSAAICDALSNERGVKMVGASIVRSAMPTAGATSPAAIGRAVHADLVVAGKVRVEGDAARVQVRLVDACAEVQPWGERIDGRLSEPFELEDRAVAEVSTAVRARSGDVGGVAGPTDVKVRAAWERGRLNYAKFAPPFVEEAIKHFREAQTLAPDDPYVLSGLGAALTRRWLFNASMERETIAEAEEMTLRALAIDPTIGDTYNTIGIMRLQHGETRAAVRAFREAIARAPLHAEAHSYLGRLLAESGYVDEAMRRFDLAIRLDSMALVSHVEKARTLALCGDRAASMAVTERAVALGGVMGGLMAQARFVLWFNDRKLAMRVVETVEKAGMRKSLTGSQVFFMLDAFAKDRPASELIQLFHAYVDRSPSSPRQRSFFFQLATEFAAATNNMEEAFQALEKAASLPLVDLLWVDRCPPLDRMRDDARFVRVRAIVAARVAEIWS